LRLTRSGATITGYESLDGTTWTPVGTATTLPGLPSTVQAGLFAASPPFSQATSRGLGSVAVTGGPALATGVFDHVSLQDAHGAGPDSAWTADLIGGTRGGLPASAEAFHQADGTFTLTGSGDIAPGLPGIGDDVGTGIDFTLVGVFAGLIAACVVASMTITAEYRRGLIHTTPAASPRRGRVLAAKAVVIAAVTFATGLAGAAAAIPICGHLLRSHGFQILPTSTGTELRVVVGVAALLAVAAVFALAVGTVLRRGSGAVTTVIVLIVLPYLLATSVLPAGPADWLLRFTPAAAFSIEQTVPRYPQVSGDSSPFNGYFPLTPRSGFAVLCVWTAAALGLAAVLLRRRDA
jgi:ABC-type transport system involved in multi-copper enzyme maturation permease subunit